MEKHSVHKAPTEEEIKSEENCKISSHFKKIQNTFDLSEGVPVLTHSSEDDTEERPRTPSGTVITANVKNISDYFNKAQKSKRSDSPSIKSINSQRRATLNRTNQTERQYKRIAKSAERKLKAKAERLIRAKDQELGLTVKRQNKQRKARKQKVSSCEQVLSDDQSSDSEGYHTPEAFVTDYQSETGFLHHLAKQLKFIDHRGETIATTTMSGNSDQEPTGHIKSVDQPNEGQTEKMQIDENATASPEMQEDPKVMALPTIAEMFNRLRQDFSELKKEVKEMKDAQTKVVSDEVVQKCKVELKETLDFIAPKENEELEKVKKELRHFKFRNQALTNVVQALSGEVDDLRSRMENVELNTSRCAVTVSGLQVDGNKKEIILQLEEFFGDALGVNVVVEDFIRTGSHQPQFLIVFLQTSQQKRDVLRFKSFLKGNTDYGRAIYINDYVPAITAEKRRKEREIKEVNQKAESPLEVSYIRGKLALQGEILTPKVAVPTPKEIVDISPQQLEKILQLQIHQTGRVSQDGSVFEAYTASVQTHQQVRELYIKLKLMQPLAKHTVCAYWVEGPLHTSRDYCDDGEPAAGKVVMDIMIQQNFKNRVVFVTRKYGGQKIGSSRFECYKAAAEVVLKAHPYNEKLGTKQVWLTPEDQSDNAHQKDSSDLHQDPNTVVKEKRGASSPLDEHYRQPPRKKQFKQPYESKQGKLNSIRGRANYYSTQRTSYDDRGWKQNRGGYSTNRRPSPPRYRQYERRSQYERRNQYDRDEWDTYDRPYGYRNRDYDNVQ